jgi:hypothetical protein
MSDYPYCMVERDPKREAHHPIRIVRVDGALIAEVKPQFECFAEEIAQAIESAIRQKESA